PAHRVQRYVGRTSAKSPSRIGRLRRSDRHEDRFNESATSRRSHTSVSTRNKREPAPPPREPALFVLLTRGEHEDRHILIKKYRPRSAAGVRRSLYWKHHGKTSRISNRSTRGGLRYGGGVRRGHDPVAE